MAFWDVLMPWNLKSTYFSLKRIHFLSLNIWYAIYVVFWIKYWNLKLPHCILFLFTIVVELDWSAESQLDTSGVTLNADLELKSHHQTPMTLTYTKVLGHIGALPKLWQQRWKLNSCIQKNMSISIATVLEMSKMIVLICNKSLVFGDEFLAQGLNLKSHQLAVFLNLALNTEGLSC